MRVPAQVPVVGGEAVSRIKGIGYVLAGLTPRHREILTLLAKHIVGYGSPASCSTCNSGSGILSRLHDKHISDRNRRADAVKQRKEKKQELKKQKKAKPKRRKKGRSAPAEDEEEPSDDNQAAGPSALGDSEDEEPIEAATRERKFAGEFRIALFLLRNNNLCGQCFRPDGRAVS